MNAGGGHQTAPLFFTLRKYPGSGGQAAATQLTREYLLVDAAHRTPIAIQGDGTVQWQCHNARNAVLSAPLVPSCYSVTQSVGARDNSG